MQRIFATIRNLGMDRLDALLLVGTLRDTEFCLFLAIPAAGFELFAITGCRKVFQTKVDTDRAGRLAEAGADRLVLAMPAATDLAEACDHVSACAQRLGLTS